ncbi:complement component receptor 1-like protein [Pagrus major]|uniref:complement component receptor 1-like protein n=1 Tax=Pagrus major TaxID=143350 RepID=UPI003CC8B0CF
MKHLGGNILILSFALLASAAQAAQAPKKCGAPVVFPHTKLASKYSSRQQFNSGEKVYYDCDDDFTPVFRSIRVVQCLNGGWTKLNLKCEKRSCGNAGELANGQFNYEGDSLIGEKVIAVCNDGYTVKGLNYMVCKRAGWSGDVPICEEGRPTCSPPAVANSASSRGDVSVHQVGDSVTFTCSQGFQLDGAQQITCGADGQWQPQPPRCLPSPETTASPARTLIPAKPMFPAKPILPARESELASGCGVPVTSSNSHASLADKYILKTSFGSGDRVQYVCEVGYIQAGGSRYRTCSKGKWTPLWLRCERKPCGSAGEIFNGRFEYSGVEFGDTAKAVCDEGYNLVGKATRTCMTKGWDGRIPVCEAVQCGEPPQVMNADMRGPREPPYAYRTVVRYQCRAGTFNGLSEIWCTEDGTWSSPPTCKEMTCPPPRVPGGSWAGARNEPYQFRDTISIECDRPYRRDGPRMVTCGRDGQWYPGLPRCLALSPRTSHRMNRWH